MFIKKLANGNYYLCGRAKEKIKKSGKPKKVKNIFLIKPVFKKDCFCEGSTNTTITTPKSLVGKKIMFKVIFVE